MATETRATAPTVKQSLLARGEKYAYFQALRLLQLFDGNIGNVRVRPKLGLGFPESDIDQIEALAEGGYRITANFFGLYGVASPLPTYYTEDLLDEAREDYHVTRDFLDIVHYAMYPLLFDAWSKYRIQKKIIEDEDKVALNHLYAFVGLEDPALRQAPDSAVLLRYAGLLNQRPRSALGLQIMLADAFSDMRVDLVCCIRHTLQIPADQQWRLGGQENSLGENLYLGTQVDDYGSGLLIKLSDVSLPRLQQMLPGAAGYQRLQFLTTFYLTDPLEIDVEIQLRQEEAEHVALSERSRLGFDTWLAPQNGPMKVKFNLHTV